MKKYLQDDVIVGPGRVGGVLCAPASKSAMQRAVAIAALAAGRSTLLNPAWCADTEAALALVAGLGVHVEATESQVVIEGPASVQAGGRLSLSCGESGLCLRMFSAVASLFDADIELTAEGSLRQRPAAMVVEPLQALGVACTVDGGLPPVKVRGPLRSGTVRIDGAESSQFLTGLLVALPMTGGESVVHVSRLASKGYVDLTLDVMRSFGAVVKRAEDFSSISIGPSPYRASGYTVEGDWSGAAFALVAGAVASVDGVTVTGLSVSSSQPDRAILEALRLAGAPVCVDARGVTVSSPGLYAGGDKAVTASPGLYAGGDNAVAASPGLYAGSDGAVAASPGLHAGGDNAVTASPGLSAGDDNAVAASPGLHAGGDNAVTASPGLHAFEFDATDCPDLFPPLVALAAFCKGTSVVRGAHRLRAKESDRAAALSREFGALGIMVTVEDDIMRVAGIGSSAGLSGALRNSNREPVRVSSHGDHRIAMAAAVATLALDRQVRIDGASAVAKSWPGFFSDLESIRQSDVEGRNG